MTDLERVRESLKYAWTHGDADYTPDLDTHLKEDAEREANLTEAFERVTEQKANMEAELTRLREELDLKDGLLNQVKGELTRLRERVHGYEEQVRGLLRAEYQRDTLLAALSRYGRHDVECKRWEVGTTRLDDRTCTCGYDAAISEVEGEK